MSDLSHKLYELSVTCGMNQKYHQAEMSLWWNISIVLMLCAIISWSILFFYMDNRHIFHISAIVGIVCVASVIFSSYNYRFYSRMFRDWSELRQNTDILKIQVDDDTAPIEYLDNYTDRYFHYWKQKNTLNMLEPAPKEKLLYKCFEDELRARGVEEKDITKEK